MKLKNVLKGLMSRYELDEISIISAENVKYSGTVECWENATLSGMQSYKEMVEKYDCINHMVLNNRKAFLFIEDPMEDSKIQFIRK